MQEPQCGHTDPPRSRSRESIRSRLASIFAQFSLISGDPEPVRSDCAKLKECLCHPPGRMDLESLKQLIPLLQKRDAPLVAPVVSLLEETVAECDNPWALLKEMLTAADKAIAMRILDFSLRLTTAKNLTVTREVLSSLAACVETEGSPLRDPEALRKIGMIMALAPDLPPGAGSPILHIYLESEYPSLRRLAARLLDIDAQPVPPEVAKRLLGAEAQEFLSPYLEYTRATYLDVLNLKPMSGAPEILDCLRRVEKICGQAAAREVIAELGWSRVNFGIYVQNLIAVSIAGSLPVMVSPAELKLLESCGDVRRVLEYYLFVTHGGMETAAGDNADCGDVISRFRAYNLTHAELLAEILDVAPLTSLKINRILDRLDRIVADFVEIFSTYTEECAILPDFYRDLKARVVEELKKEGNGQLSPELTRLVQMFEDPRSLGQVQTIHGLKRYLHQQGLKLGFRLIGAQRTPVCTVDLALMFQGRIVGKVEKIRYTNFEVGSKATEIPYPVDLVVSGFSRQLLYHNLCLAIPFRSEDENAAGKSKIAAGTFPYISVFCYGNEVHYYLTFRNHPAFLRIDYAPPLRGGMIDLQFYGVSQYDLDVHPNISMDYIKVFFQNLDFDIQVDVTHIHARYDKERALDLGVLCKKAEALFCLVPYLMDIDWIIGSLELDAEARGKVAKAWAELFARWQTLPVQQLLTKDRKGILEFSEAGLTGHREVKWSGKETYRDRFRADLSETFLRNFCAALQRLGLENLPLFDEEGRTLHPADVEKELLRPLREALRRGEIAETPEGFRSLPPESFRRRHEAEKFAEILCSDKEILISSIALARLIAPLERTLRFHSTGYVEGLEVQKAILPLRGENLGLYVLRDEKGIIRLAIFARDEVLCSCRKRASGPWQSNASSDVAEMTTLLRRNNYLAAGTESLVDVTEELQKIRDSLQTKKSIQPGPLPGEKIVTGLTASPGRVVGKVMFVAGNRSPKDFEGKILVTPTIRPEDNTALYHAAGVVSTGGGILSHAGLIAIQFHKPAMIISGRWQQGNDGVMKLFYKTIHYCVEEIDSHGYRVNMMRNLRECEYFLCEGDLVILDAREGILRIFGQNWDALALYEEFRVSAETSRLLARAVAENEILTLRGRKLRARHQIEKIFRRLHDPIIAKYAVYEILLGEAFSLSSDKSDEKAQLLGLLLDNPNIGETSRDCLLQNAKKLGQCYRSLAQKTQRSIPGSIYTYEILSLRLELLRLRRTLSGAAELLRQCGMSTEFIAGSDNFDVDILSFKRMEELRDSRTRYALSRPPAVENRSTIRHLFRQIERDDLILGAPGKNSRQVHELLAQIGEDRPACDRSQSLYVLKSEDCGMERFSSIGWKAANLGEIERLGLKGATPPWFVVTDHSFQEILDTSLNDIAPSLADNSAPNLRGLIAATLARPDLSPSQKSANIQKFWEEVILPRRLVEEILGAYRQLGRKSPERIEDADSDEPFVAIRSSTREEDAESATRAGEFETFLFIRGETSLLQYLKYTWSSLWTERAIHNRSVLNLNCGETGGGVIVQRIVWSRVSGVLQTVNTAKGEYREMVINAGLGLGEGIVSGVVAADQITVDKEGNRENGPLRFSYITSDKRERVVFDRRLGMGTTVVETLYHQRLRPSLEYLELQELVGMASRLEAVYGYPLDIEFGIEGTRLWLLQVRPLATFGPVMEETLANYPLRGKLQSIGLT